uniref:Sushi domain-containing protein n=1 Tax=Tetradesmus obliquus TaxID=3088 RepID=A0A383VYJ3_TETOB
MRHHQLVLLLLLTAVACSVRAQPSENAGPAAAAARAAPRRCPSGYRIGSKDEVSSNNNVIDWTRGQSGLAGVIVFNRMFACKCAPGWGSHVPGWAGAGNLPTAPPNCPFLLVNGNNEPSCRCSRCPTGYTSTGGLLNSAAAACRPTGGPPRPPPSPSPPPAGAPQTAFIRVKFTAPASSNPCAAARQTRLANALAAGIQKRRPNARNVKVTVRSCRAVTTARRVATLRQVDNQYQIDFQVTFQGQPADRNDIITTADNTNTQAGLCTLGPCTEITAAGGTVTGADGSLTPPDNPPTTPSPSPKPPTSPNPPPAADKCASKPTDSTPNSTGWPASCAGTAVGASCKAPCDTAAGATGVGYTIDCNDVDLWGDVTGRCTAAPKTCSKAPTATAELTNQTTGWPASCVGAAVGATCQAPCKSTYTGIGYTTSCTAADTWGAPTGSCTLKTCSGAPGTSTLTNSTGFPASCTNLPIGATCTAACTAAATGTGFLATCGDGQTWTVSGSCTAKVCLGVPTAASNAAAWNSTACSGKLVGGTCSAACLSSATGAGYVATCREDSTWNVTGSCAAKVCPTAPADTRAPNSAGFNDATCANTTVGGTPCTAACSANATGPGYTATCTDTNNWNVTGNCTLRGCDTAPATAANGGNWLSATGGPCSGVPSGGICRSNCTFSGTGGPYTATCIAGAWTITGNCTLKTCTNLPPAATNSVAWPSTSNSTAGITSCIGTAINSTCRTPCAANAAGPGFTATCNDTNSWAVTGSCAIRNCTTQPSFNLTLMADWSVNCSSTVNGGNCSAACLPTATGPGYTSVCREGTWLNATGTCVAKTCFQSPPDAFNQAPGWACPSNVSSSTQLGQSCRANCAINSTGPGYEAVCTNDADFWPGMNGTVNATTGQIINGSVVPRPTNVFGTWRVTGSCQLKVCPGLPPTTTPNAVSEWNVSCTNLTAGSNCTLGCAANSSGIGYTALCINGNWTVTGACALKQCPTQPPTTINGTQLPNRAQAPWNCSATTAGGVCSMPCSNVASGMYFATCGNDANWTISGGCPLRACSGVPPQQAFAEEWPAACSNATHGSLCNATCWGNSTGTWQALCDAGNWTVTTPATAGCKLKTCPGLPPAQNLTLAWNASCANTVHGSICEANCTANATGLARAQCSNGSWVVLQATTCALRGCPDVPVPKLNANNFSAECAGQPHGGQCTAICFVNAFGGWTATCNANSGWVYTGGCPLKRCTGLPSQQFNAGAWNASTSNATVGSSFAINCTANITEGSGYTAACVADAIMPYGNWSVTGACPLKTCAGLPPALMYTNDWPESCTNATHGDVCNATCNEQGNGRAQVRCDAGQWQAPSLVCTPKRCATLPSTPANAEGTWNTSFRNASVNTQMALGCTPNITDGEGYTASCVENANATTANWTVNGSCTLKVCSGLPEFQVNSAGWPDSCTNRTHGFVCNGTCAGNSTGRTQASCVAGAWQVNSNASCTLRTCTGLPRANATLSNGWNSSCANTTHGTMCTATCVSNATGLWEATCDSGNWAVPAGSGCQLKRCMGLPPTDTLNLSLGWNASCENATHGSSCTAACDSTAFAPNGRGYSAQCVEGNWQVSTATNATCLWLPTITTPANSVGWEACNNTVHNTNCSAPCNSNATGGYVSTCFEGRWTASNSTCEIKRCPSLPSLPAARELLNGEWPPAGANATVGYVMTLNCSSNNTEGGGYTATCGNTAALTGIWTVTGDGCRRKRCLGAPTLTPAQAYSDGFNSSCVNVTAFGTCTAPCKSIEAEGTGYTATCNEGNYTVTGACALRTCTAAPSLPAVNSPGWSTNCANTTWGTICEAKCAWNAFGAGYNATCTGTNKWEPSSSGNCTLKRCPILRANPINSIVISEFSNSSWYMLDRSEKKIACSGDLLFTNCKADCGPNTDGTGYNMECKETGEWAQWGSCTEKRCGATPQLGLQLPDPDGRIYVEGWQLSNSTSACPDQAAPGTVCTAACKEPFSSGSGINVECRRGEWGTTWSGCSVTKCSGQPPAVEYSVGWGTTCNNTAVDAPCSLQCNSTLSSGSTVTATCTKWSDGVTNYTISGSCPRKTCRSAPDANLIPNSLGWDTGCAGKFLGDKCSANCTTGKAIGTGYTATCTDGGWSSYSGECYGICQFAELPPRPDNSVGDWTINCQSTPAGSSLCSALCAAGFQGPGWTIPCQQDLQWGNATAVATQAGTGCTVIPNGG